MEQNNSPYTIAQSGLNPSQEKQTYPQQQHTTTVIHQQPVMPMVLGPQPSTMICPHCHARITTAVQTEATTKTHLFALLLCLCGCWCCCCIPYCMDSCQSQIHNCPNCNAFLGKCDN